jgi:hypothetical protein
MFRNRLIICNIYGTVHCSEYQKPFPKLMGMADIVQRSIHSIHPRTLNTYFLIISYNIMLAENNVQSMHQTTLRSHHNVNLSLFTLLPFSFAFFRDSLSRTTSLTSLVTPRLSVALLFLLRIVFSSEGLMKR